MNESSAPAAAETLADIEVRKTNELLRAGSLWDGFWVRGFEHGVLSVAGSFDRSYYRDVEIRFFGTIFFNLPNQWADTDCKEGAWFRRSTVQELLDVCGPSNGLDEAQIGELPWVGLNVYAFDLSFAWPVDPASPGPRRYTAFVVARYFEAFKVIVGDGSAEYQEPLTTERFPSPRNRVPLLRGFLIE